MDAQEPEVFSADALRKRLSTRIIGRRIIYHDRLPSTMDAAREAARNGISEGAVIITGEQVRGRGRLNREWLTPAGNIALSIILYPDRETLPYLIMMAATAVCRGIEAVTGLKPGIKWPNDILINGKKVCGILIENELPYKGSVTAVIGIGINTGLQPEAYREITETATSLEREAGMGISRTEIIVGLLEAFDELYDPGQDRATVYADWKARLVTLGEQVTVTWKDNVLEGTAESVDESGALVLRLPDGSTTVVVAGDVTLRKNNEAEEPESFDPADESEDT
ncbi:MAG: biotin--[acetyl-CoA-carboxylase] ligase [Dehalococcoidales bacterium]|nr:biotin--[acetyl-CoA-carboxylase] ligase [Dehalococcoidales bacterium]